MNDLISRSALIEALVHCDGLGRKSCEAVLKTINEQPTVEAKPVVRGKDRCDEYEGHCEFWCSECGYFLYEVIPRGCVDDCDCDRDCDGDFNHCPNCGADIREDVD